MRVAYLYQYFNTPEMPGGSRSYEMGRRLVAAGHEVHVVTSWRQPTNKRGWYTTVEQGLHVHWLPVEYSNKMSYDRRIRAFFEFAVRSGIKAASLRPDVVFATSTPLTIALPGIFAARRSRAPFVFEVRDLWPAVPIALGALRSPAARWLAHRLERLAYTNATRIVALSPGMAEGVRNTGYPTDRISVIPNSADLDLFEPNPAAADAFRSKHPELGSGPIVLYAGTLGKVTGVDYLVHVADHLRHTLPDARCVIIGAGHDEERIRALAEAKGVLGLNLFMYDPLPKQQVVGAFAAAAVVTSLVIDQPELEANSANKFFDGLASGTPIAINYGGWQADLLRETEAGVVLSRDARVAAEQLTELLGSVERLRSAGERARELAERRFSRDLLAARLGDVLVSAVAEWKQAAK